MCMIAMLYSCYELHFSGRSSSDFGFRFNNIKGSFEKPTPSRF